MELKQYLRKSRSDFAKEMAKYPVDEFRDLRTNVDTFLIAYDKALSSLDLNMKLVKVLKNKK